MRKILIALVAAVTVGAVLLVMSRRDDAPPTNSAVVNAPDPAPPDPAPYRAAFPLTAPEVPTIEGTSPVDRALEQALVPFRAGQYRPAATALDGLLLDYPGEARVQLYLGIARLFEDEAPNALELLRPLEFNAPPEVAAEAAWYALVGIARLRDPSGVETEADALCRRGWPTSQRACDALAMLRASK